MKPIYEPKGKAKEYGDYAINIYTGCPHRCFYCFAPNILHRDREAFHSHVEPRPYIVEAVKDQLEHDQINGKLIHLCFTCDPYPTGYDSTPTREIIKLLKDHGNHVQILTKGDGYRDFDLMDSDDWYGITIDGSEDDTPEYAHRLCSIVDAHYAGIKTWVSFEPVINADRVLSDILAVADVRIINKIKIGKLNYFSSDIDWADFGRKAESLCQDRGFDYYIKESLRAEMEAANGS